MPLSGWFAGIMDDKLKDLPDGSIARLVRQNFHLKYVIPEAILRLSKNPIAGKHYILLYRLLILLRNYLKIWSQVMMSLVLVKG